ncbi:MAG: carboxy-S-adenosyl-L-methionine synthase CmoA [Proteobacteria bacterium]|nr:carboxy-S-adenosyl-L-methionine synthase CmoA [Pseudomonadota bacterium]
MTEDRIFAAEDAGSGPFEFNDAVAEVFPDMLQRSIPGYAASILTIGSLARRYVRPETHCFDLGCSLGAATIAMRHNISGPGCRIQAIDSSPAMIRRCRKIIAADDASVPVDVIAGDVREADIENASMVVMNYTLQFLPLADRDDMITKVCEGMNSGGIFVLSEKIVDDDREIEELLVDLHREQKRRNAYSDSEISRKREAIENVLMPESLAAHEARLKNAGFSHISVWLRYFNFISVVAIK